MRRVLAKYIGKPLLATEISKPPDKTKYESLLQFSAPHGLIRSYRKNDEEEPPTFATITGADTHTVTQKTALSFTKRTIFWS